MYINKYFVTFPQHNSDRRLNPQEEMRHFNMRKMMVETVMVEITKVIPYFLKHKTVWSDYDEEADILYLHFKKPNHADPAEMTEDEIIIRHENNEVIGLSILNARQRGNAL